MKSKGRVWQPGNEPITFFPHLPRCSLLRHCHTIKHPTQLPSRSQDGRTSENNVNSGSPAFQYLSIAGVAIAPTPPALSRHVGCLFLFGLIFAFSRRCRRWHLHYSLTCTGFLELDTQMRCHEGKLGKLYPESSTPTRYVNHRATAFVLKEPLISFILPKTDLLTKYNFAASADKMPSTLKPVFVAELRSHATYTHIHTSAPSRAARAQGSPEKGIRLLRHLSQSAVLLPIHQNNITPIEVST
ncbi:hypothetical protein F5141DRAFT_742536 [Pisolithus sp. B1]|nr:hypothetical protein F5141DRAFT_742536 [Pisolithus sp. B1]